MTQKQESAAERKKRLARALRANIAKRKAQAKRRESAPAKPEQAEKR